jgi:diguanylate cyclase (GGDEF)-like protein/PAS domain S-box-containing protein
MKSERKSAPNAWSLAWRSPAILIAVLMAPVLWAVYFINASIEKERALEHAKSQTAGVVRVFQEGTERVLLDVDRTLRLLRLLYLTNSQSFDLKFWVESASSISAATVRYTMVGPDGYMVATTGGYQGPPLYLGDSDHFNKVKSLKDDDFFIATPVRGRMSGKWSVLMSRRITAADGTFGGEIMGAIDPSAFGEFFDSFHLGTRGSVLLRNLDGAVLFSKGLSSPPVGTRAVSPQLQEALENSPVGHVWGPGMFSGMNRLVAYRKSSTLPLFFAGGIPEVDILADYQRYQSLYLSILIAFTIVLAGAAFLDIRRRLKLAQTQHELEEVAARFKSAIENISQGLSMFDAQHRLVAYNDKYLQMLNLSPEQVRLGCSFRELLELRNATGSLRHNIDSYIEEITGGIARGEQIEITANLPDGRIIRVVNCPKADGGWVATHQDITDHQRAEVELANVRTFLDTIIQNMPVPVVIRDVNTRQYLLVNRAYESLFGIPREKMLGTTVREHFPEDVAERLMRHDDDAIKSHDSVVIDEIPVETRTNGRRIVTMTRLVVRDNSQKPQYLIVIVDDVTERKRSEAKIERLAHYDGLTNLANRNLFRERIEECLARQRRMGTEFAVFLLDLDKFKAVNDRLGHQAGDTLLCEVAARLKATIREVDVAARIGGDEFALIVMPGRDAMKDGAATLAARLVEVISAPYEIEGQSVVVGCSIGAAVAPAHGERSDELLRNADLALYKSKNGGRNCFHIYGEEFKLEADSRNALENDLREAIWREEFELFYQPVIDIATGAVTAVEALLRWRHPVKGLILPDHFIPLAEQTGLIIPMGEWAMIRACRDAMLMPQDVKVAVNLSPIQFAKSNLVEAAIFALVDSQLPPERLEFEVTEGVLLQETEQNLEILRQLKNLGVSIALDDFGVGYSSLGYLTSFPFGKVKIDRSFVKRLDKPESKAVVSSIVQLSRSLNLVTAAEGIETEAQLDVVQSMGVDLGQGFLFGRPQPLADLNFSVVRAAARTRAA